jgi:hypothetical protein
VTAPKTMRQIGKALKGMKKAGMTQPATLRKFTIGARTGGALTGGQTQTPTDYACHVTVSDDTHEKINGTAVEKSDVVWILYGQMIAGGVEPDTNAKLVVDAVTYRIIDFEKKGAGAAYIVLARR